MWTCRAKADDFGVHLNELSIDYARYKPDSREPVIYPILPKERLDVGIKIDFLKYGYLNNRIHSLTDHSQFRLIGWNYQLGVHILDYADLYIEHFSQHILDQTISNYPVENLIGVKVYLYKRKRGD